MSKNNRKLFKIVKKLNILKIYYFDFVQSSIQN